MAQYFLSSSYLIRQSKISLPFIKLVNPSNVSEASLKNTVFGIILCGAFRTLFQIRYCCRTWRCTQIHQGVL